MNDSRKNPVVYKSFEFALSILDLTLKLNHHYKVYSLSDQLLRSGTSIGANVEEAIGAFSKKDFLYKMTIAYKEARESHYWLRLIHASENFQEIHKALPTEQAIELQKIIGSICKTSKQKLQHNSDQIK